MEKVGLYSRPTSKMQSDISRKSLIQKSPTKHKRIGEVERYSVTMSPIHFIILMSSQQTQNICTTFVQRRRRWSNIVQMSYKCFVFAG